MGSVGKSTIAVPSTVPQTPTPTVGLADDADQKTIVSYYKDNWGIDIGGSYFQNSVDNKFLIDAAKQFAALQNELGADVMKEAAVRVIAVKDKKHSSAYAWTSLVSNQITLNAIPKFFGNANAVTNIYNGDVSQGFHPKGTSVSDVIIHEFAHNLEYVLIRRSFPTTSGQIIACNSGALAKSIVQQAYADVNKAYPGRYKTEKQARLAISGYANAKKSGGGVNYHETLAEAITDVARNGDKAHRISKAIFAGVKTLLNT